MFFPKTGVCFFILTFFWTSGSLKSVMSAKFPCCSGVEKPEVSSQEHYGCDFDTLAKSKVTNALNGEFGYMGLYKILRFKNTQDFWKFYDKVATIFSQFKMNREYNSLSNYLRFYQTYTALKECPGYPGFKEFHQKYLMENFPYDEAGGNAIQLMEKLSKEFPELAKSAYFVTRSEISVDNLNLLKQNFRTASSMSLPDFFRHEQIAVVIKFRYKGERGYGFILLDPEMPEVNPAVFRLDSELEVPGGISEKVDFTIVKSDNMSFADGQFISASVRYGFFDEPTLYVYDFKRPYCTFIETTMKSSLLSFKHSKELFDNKGVSHAKLIVNIGLDARQLWTYNVKFLLYDKEDTETVTIPLVWPNNNEELLHIQNNLYRLCGRLGMHKQDCFYSLKKEIQLFQSIYKDKGFLRRSQEILEMKNSSAPWVDEENSSWAVLSKIDPSTISTNVSSFKYPNRDMFWKVLEKADDFLRCKSYGYDNPTSNQKY